ncbi:DUF3375 family protein [Mycobacterium hubeiense]|uniref:DUF3375 family protein n=1 Tax=Mycobacterium hubeiense TaxID=1867256 RepID=UPI000C7F2C21|nr:DUF3375 family protein [Mycobacterium sp. QGD 101]
MSDIAAALARAQRAFAKPTLSLLARKNAPVVVAIFSLAFNQERSVVTAERFHTLIDALISELRAAGADSFDEPARVLCRRWVNEQWLVLATSDTGEEEYSLTSHAREAIDYVHRLGGDRSVFGESRIRTIVEAARRCAMDADPDTDARVARLDEQIIALRAERDRLAAGSTADPVPQARVVEQYLNVRDMTAQLPADFLRLSEHVKDIHRTLVADFQQEGRRTGDVLDTYLARSSALMSESLEGKAFMGAVELLRDEKLMGQLRRDLDTIAAHPFAASQPAGEIADFRTTVASIRRGVTAVLEARRKLSSTLRAYITSHDALRDRDLDDALREAKKQLAGWMRVSGPRARVPLPLGLAPLQIGNTRQRFFDPAEHAAPPPLADPAADAQPAPSLQALRRRGGPSVAALRAAVAAALDGDETSAAEVFNALPEELRRPVEVLGLMQLAAHIGALDDADSLGTEVVDTVRVDGSRRQLRLPTISLGQRHRAGLAPVDSGEGASS